jgi:CDP-glucose 4,6-dehydratase
MEPMRNRDFWRGKRVFITGHTGFKGSWLSLWLQQLGAEVVGYALRPPTRPSLFETACVADGMTSIQGDVRDAQSLKTALKNAEPEIIIHLAAQSLVRYAYLDPVETYSTNVLGTVHLLEAIRHIGGVKAVVIVTADRCYDAREWYWSYRENEPMGGRDPYGSSMGCAELVTATFRDAYFNPGYYDRHGVAIASARAGNVIGGGDWTEDHLVPDVLHALTLGEPVIIRNPHAVRAWQHVLEPLSGYLLLAEKLYDVGPVYADAWNFGPAEADAKSVQWLVEHLISYWGEGACWRSDRRPHLHDAEYLKLDCAKACNVLGWSTRWSLNQTLEGIVAWHKLLRDEGDMRAFTLQQIADYDDDHGSAYNVQTLAPAVGA